MSRKTKDVRLDQQKISFTFRDRNYI